MDNIKLSLTNFRNELDEKALERGWFYFSKGWVQNPKEVLPRFYECVVNEVNPHAVSYSIEDNGEVNDVFCTCGASSGRSNSPKGRTDEATSWCRHLAAVLYKLENDSGDAAPENEHII